MKMPNKQCNRCKKWTTRRKIINSKTHDWCYSLLYLEEISFNTGQNIFLCDQCWFTLRTEKTHTKNQIENEEAHIECENNNEHTNDAYNMDIITYSNEDSLTIENVLFASSGHRKCIICRAEVNKNMVMMPKP